MSFLKTKKSFKCGRYWLVLFAALSVPAEAAITTYDDKTAFLNATGATNATGAIPAFPYVYSKTIGSITFSTTHAAFHGEDLISYNDGIEIGVNDREHMQMQSSTPVFAMGFVFIEPHGSSAYFDGCNATCIDSTFSVTVKSGTTSVGSFTFNAPNNQVAFIGVSSSVAFDTLVIQETTGWIENENYGEVYTSTTAEVNQLPLANAGSDQSVRPGDSVTLDGSGSSDPDENYPLIYAWEITSKPAGSTAALTNADLVNPSFTADLVGDYIVELVVTDDLGAESEVDEVLVSTVNTPPVADAGPDQALDLVGTTVQLDGSQSYDEDGDPFTYQWTMTTKPLASAATLSGANTAAPSFVADINGDYTVGLVVTDIFNAVSAEDSVMISFNNVRPVADAGMNQAVVAGETVFLDGSGSSDANLDPLYYYWGIVSVPDGSAAALNDQTSVHTSFMTDLPGTYVIGLTVNDGFVDSDTSNVTVTAISVQNAVTHGLSSVISIINGFDSGVFKNANMRNALTNKLNAVLALVDQGLYEDARDKLENDILQKMNGCAEAGTPDNNDWITDCAAQQQLYPKITEAIALLSNLI